MQELFNHKDRNMDIKYETELPERIDSWLIFYDLLDGMQKDVGMNFNTDDRIQFRCYDGEVRWWKFSHIIHQVALELLAARPTRFQVHKFQMGLAQLPVVLPEVNEAIDKLYKICVHTK